MHMEMYTVEKLQGGELGGEKNMWRMSAEAEWGVGHIGEGGGGKKADCQTLSHSFLIYPPLQSPRYW